VSITRADGTSAGYDSAAYGGGTSADTNGADANPNDSAHPLTFAVTMDPNGPTTQAFEVVVTLQCNGMNTTVDDQTIKLMRCDRNAYSEAQREYEMAEQLAALGEKELEKADESDGEIDQEVRDEAAKTIIDGEGLGELLAALEHGAVITPESALFVEVLHAGTELFGLALQAELRSQDWSRLTKGAHSDFVLAERALDRANADLARALAEGTACAKPLHDQLNKLLADRKRLDDARDLIDKWQNNGYLYVSPISHEIVDEATALKQAEAALKGHPAKPSADARSARASARVNAADLRAAIRDVDAALGDNRSVRRDLGRLEAASKTLLKRLNALLAS